MGSLINEQDSAAVGGQVRSLITSYLGAIAFPSDRSVFSTQMERLSALLAFWGTRMNLTAAAADPNEIAFHIIDSLAPIIFSHDGSLPREILAAGSRVLDLGSGAGFPGLVLASVSSAAFTLVESRRKR